MRSLYLQVLWVEGAALPLSHSQSLRRHSVTAHSLTHSLTHLHLIELVGWLVGWLVAGVFR